MAYAFFLSIDVTEEEPATLVLLEKTADDPDDTPVYHVRDIQRMRAEPEDKEEVGYAADDVAPGLVDEVQTLIADAPYTGRTIVVVNSTNKRGQGLLAALTERGLAPVGVSVTGGEGAAEQGAGLKLEGGGDAGEDAAASLYVSERALLSRLDALHRDGRLKLAEGNVQGASELAHGLQSYRADLDAADADPDAFDSAERTREQEEPLRAPAHASHLLAAAMGCWLGEERAFDPTEHLEGDLPTTGEAKRMIRPDTTS